MNPPFSALANVQNRTADATVSHVVSALTRLPRGGRLVAITGANFSAENPSFAAAFARIRALGQVVFTAAIDGKAYAKHGTTIDTRLTVIDRAPAEKLCCSRRVGRHRCRCCHAPGLGDAACAATGQIASIAVPNSAPAVLPARAAIPGRRTILPRA